MSLFLALLLLAPFHSFVINTDEKGSLIAQRIPSYIGRSYHLLKGNPLTDRVGPGFF